MEEQLSLEMAEKITSMHTDIQWMKQRMEKLDDKYAKQWVEKAMTSLIGFIIFAVLGALMGLIILRPALAAALGLG